MCTRCNSIMDSFYYLIPEYIFHFSIMILFFKKCYTIPETGFIIHMFIICSRLKLYCEYELALKSFKEMMFIIPKNNR